MSDSELDYLTIADAAKRIRTRALSPVELTQALLRRIERLDAQIHAFNTLLPEQALSAARAAETEIANGRYRGPMHGIPFGAKDVYDTAGVLTSGYSRAYLNNVPAEDATAVAKLRAAGAILMGKLATHELANGGPSFDLPWPPARNPWKTTHFTGGSSTGPGAAVAAGFLPGALGTDTGGSIRIPAALCGVVGLKPTFGLVSRAGVIPHSYSFDHCGPLARTVEDCAIFLQAIVGHDPREPASAERAFEDYYGALNGDIRGLRIGVARHYWEEELVAPPEVCRAMNEAIAVFCKLGATVEDVRLPSLQRHYDVKTVITKPEVFEVHRRKLVERIDDFGSDFLALTLPGCLFSGVDYARARSERRWLTCAMSEVFARHDALLTAGSGPAAPLGATSANRAVDHWTKPNFETVFNVTRGPALALCNGYTPDGLPLSMQLAARPFGEATLLRIAHAYEHATAWRDRRPLLIPGAAAIERPVTIAADKKSGDSATQEYVRVMARHAGLTLTDARLAHLSTLAPFALAAASRLAK
jgi:aspartyl-tRNA(Asn)/glutamyl-tRNA(Gln) amidotransferase subunit A